jgi:phage gpG-like protein
VNLDVRAKCGNAIAKCSSLESALRSIGNGSYRREIMQPIIDHARELADEVYVLDASPDGTPWVPVKKDHGEALEDTGAMRADLYAERGAYNPNGFTIVVGYNSPIARHHHYGTKHGGPISDDARKPFHPKMRRGNRWENIRASSHFNPKHGTFGTTEREHIPARPLLPIDGINAPRWETALEDTWANSFEDWLQNKAAF